MVDIVIRMTSGMFLSISPTIYMVLEYIYLSRSATSDVASRESALGRELGTSLTLCIKDFFIFFPFLIVGCSSLVQNIYIYLSCSSTSDVASRESALGRELGPSLTLCIKEFHIFHIFANRGLQFVGNNLLW